MRQLDFSERNTCKTKYDLGTKYALNKVSTLSALDRKQVEV